MKQRDNLNSKMKHLHGDQKLLMHLEYKKARNRCSTLQRSDTIKNNVTKFSGLTNPKDTWRAAKAIITPRNDCGLQLMVGDELIQEESRVANVMNDFFITKVEGLRQKIDPTGLPDPLNKRSDCSNSKFQLTRVSESQVLHAISKLKSKPSSGLDQINSNVLKAGGEVLAVPLQFIINTSITSGIFPKRWREAKVTPIHKKGDTQLVDNYRPISNLSVLSKVLEMVVLNQISRHCEQEGIIPTHQHGFQKGKSTTTANISMFDTWQKELEKKNSIGVLMFDLSAAFDLLDHNILKRKLTSLNFDPHSVQWINSFMSERVQQVQIGGSISPKRQLEAGVPQGSILSPLLFLLYICDIQEWVPEATIHGYADDTTLTMSSPNMNSLKLGLETAADKVLIYMAANKLVANPQKTKFLLMRGIHHKKWPETSIRVGGDSIKESTHEKLLGVTVSNDLKWKHHHQQLVCNLRHRVFVIRRLVQNLPRQVIVGLLDGLVHSSVRYCLALYGSMRLSELDQKSQWPCKVQVQVNNALRLALGVKKMDHISVEELLDRTNSLSYNQLVIQATQRLTSSIIKGDCKGLKGFFECDLESKRTTRSSVKGDLLPPTMKNIPSQGFRHQSVKLWNSKTSVDMQNAKMTKMQLRTFPK
jgi:retron-type reverse transcriptase